MMENLELLEHFHERDCRELALILDILGRHINTFLVFSVHDSRFAPLEGHDTSHQFSETSSLA